MPNANLSLPSESHKCEAVRDGDWVIFRCSQCVGYERRMNWRTREMHVENSQPNVNHSGFYYSELFTSCSRN